MRRVLWIPVWMLFTVVVVGCGSSNVVANLGHPVPVVKSVTVSPAALGYDGGTVTLSASVESPRPLQSVTAKVVQVQPPATGVRYETLTASSNATYQAVIPLPSNTSPGGLVAIHEITVTATDISGGVSAPFTLTVQVAAPDAPPAPQ